jgi:hypothetical protein
MTMPEEELTPLLVAVVPLLLPVVVPLAVPLLVAVVPPLLDAVVPPLLDAVVPPLLDAVVPPLLVAVVPPVVVPPSLPSPGDVLLELPQAAMAHARTTATDASAESSLNFILLMARMLARGIPSYDRASSPRVAIALAD